MSTVRIFVEGTADEQFLRELIADCCAESECRRFVFQPLGGKDNLLAPVHWQSQASFFQEITDAGGTNLVIIDTDNSHTDRVDELRKFQEATSAQFATFLLPDDNRPGELEDLLFDAVPAENQQILTCYDGMLDCLRAAVPPFKVPNAKEKKVYVYLDIVLPDPSEQRKLIQPPKRPFRGVSHWNLSANGVEKLRAFLRQHLLTT